MLLRRQDLFAQNDVRVWHQPLEAPDNCPLRRRRLHGVHAADYEIRRSHDDSAVPVDSRRNRWSRSARHACRAAAAIDRERLISDPFNRLGHRKHSGGLAHLLFVGAVHCNPIGDEALLLFVERSCSARFWRLSPLALRSARKRRCASGGMSFARPCWSQASNNTRPRSVMM